jgi:uncharacterized protein (TIGR02271 family)
MSRPEERYATVRDSNGVRGKVNLQQLQSGESRVEVAFDQHRLLVAREDLVEQPDGTYRLPVSLADWADLAKDGKHDLQEIRVLPVVEETLEVGKVRRQTRVRVSKQVEEWNEDVSLPYFSEEVEVERVPINREVEKAPDVRREGDTVILPVLEEVLVVERRLMLKEEVHIRKRQEEHEHRETVRLRRDNVSVERTDLED